MFRADRPPKKAFFTQVRSMYPSALGRPRPSFNDVASVTAKVVLSVTAKVVASVDLTENHNVGRGQRRNRGKLGLVSRH